MKRNSRESPTAVSESYGTQQQEIKQSGEVPISQFLLYFLHLGTFGFGGPIALASRMESDLVRERNWISQDGVGNFGPLRKVRRAAPIASCF